MIALHRPLRLWPLVVALAAVGAQAVGAQVGTTTDIITGTVTGPDSQPLAGAVVVATSLETRVSRQRTTDAHGRFTIVFPDGGGRETRVSRSEEHTSELQSQSNLVCRLLLEKK